MHTAFPRAARDRIYSFLIGPHNDEHVIEHDDLTKNGVIGRPGLTFRNPSLSKPGSTRSIHWWSSNYMGKAITKEVAEHWYATRHFVFRANNLHILNRFL
jgi:hypothetical protein